MEESKIVKKNIFEKWFGRILTVRGISEMAIFVAMGIIFDLPFLKIKLSVVGSISLTMVPLFIIALRFPLIDSFLGIGAVYGLITSLIDSGYIISSYPLDYLLGYGSIAIASFFRFLIFNKKFKRSLRYVILALAVILGVSARIFWSTISGMIFYKAPTFLASFIINAPEMAISAVLVIVVLFVLFPTLERFNMQIYLRGFNNRQ